MIASRNLFCLLTLVFGSFSTANINPDNHVNNVFIESFSNNALNFVLTLKFGKNYGEVGLATVI